MSYDACVGLNFVFIQYYIHASERNVSVQNSVVELDSNVGRLTSLFFICLTMKMRLILWFILANVLYFKGTNQAVLRSSYKNDRSRSYKMKKK